MNPEIIKKLVKRKLGDYLTKIFDNLSVQDIVKRIFLKEYSVNLIRDILIYYEIDPDSAIVKDTIFTLFFHQEKYHSKIYLFATEIAKNPWPEAEIIFLKNPIWKKGYFMEILKLKSA